MRYAKRLAVAVLVGSAVPVVPLTLFSAVVAVMSALDAVDRGRSLWPALRILVLPSIVAVPIVAAATVVLGLPIHMLLVRTRRASDLGYSLAGGGVGLALPMTLLALTGSTDDIVLPALGLVSGAATGHAWWRCREPREG